MPKDDDSPLKPVMDSIRQKVLAPKERPLIFADTREFSSEVVGELSKHDCVVKSKLLVVGDYLVSDRIAIERKTSQDFVSSIMDRRLWDQASALKKNFEKPVLIIEGNNLYERINPNAVRGAFAALAVDFAIPMIWTTDAKETAAMIYWLAKREQLDEKREIALRGDKKAETVNEKQEFLISGLPGISIVRARTLLKHFKTPTNLFTATEEDCKNYPRHTRQRIFFKKEVIACRSQ